MPDVTEIQLPGVGVRHEFTTDRGERVGVLAHRTGRREVVVYDRDDPDRCTTIVHLSPDDTRTLADILGATQISEVLAAVQQRIEGLAIDWLTIPDTSRFVDTTLGEGKFRSLTGVSIVAVVRGDTTIPAPGPDLLLEAGDVAVSVGTPAGLAELRRLLAA